MVSMGLSMPCCGTYFGTKDSATIVQSVQALIHLVELRATRPNHSYSATLSALVKVLDDGRATLPSACEKVLS